MMKTPAKKVDLNSTKENNTSTKHVTPAKSAKKSKVNLNTHKESESSIFTVTPAKSAKKVKGNIKTPKENEVSLIIGVTPGKSAKKIKGRPTPKENEVSLVGVTPGKSAKKIKGRPIESALEIEPSTTFNSPTESKPITTATPKLKQKAIKRKSGGSDTVLNSETKKKRRRRSKSSNQTKQSLDKKRIKKVKKSKRRIDLNLDNKKICKVVKGLLSVLEEKRKDASNELFGDEAQNICLQVNCIKKPICPTRLLRFTLPHPIYNELSEICLFVPDKKRVKKDVDKTVEYYTEMLEQHKITNISKVLPMRALSTEYTQFEMRRKLSNQFDVFLADGRISHLITKRLGRCFAYCAKTPVPISLVGSDWKNIVDKALSKTQMTIRGSSDSNSVIVGTTIQSAEEIASNIEAVCRGIAKEYPGGWVNVRSLLLSTRSVPALPVYLSLVSPNKVHVPVMESIKAPKKEVVEDELSTMLDTIVKVESDGTVTVKKTKPKQTTKESDDEDEAIIKEAMKHKKQSKTIREHEGEDVDNDRITKETELKVLKKLASGKTGDSESEVEEEKQIEPVKKQPKVAEKKDKKVKKSPKHLEKKAKTNWIKSTKKGVKKLSKDQRKALIKVKKAEKIKK